ncbi:polyprenyl synthetase family protein [Allorhodopirellula heiligendammensis]|uniref:All-trans-nonaprenyl-diphosphate synthase (Geranyl-diphosphate specific) n=1 Tax=Allorhodopirellula heiligendammensis TaxID=2714739 RepID=A0A5C6BTQ6_9BACT|nr:polyprenyl synthetase family protein [Allorhodopirellula heiligendammensis]TWU15408.1 All-trans-nonaprenyl-diphosphate synthase (geranyl-diphosphate specific) [Allorhodopirellula heiligendammensis]
MRESLRDRCREVADRLDRDHPLTKDEMEQVARQMLTEADLPEGLLGWTMVNISSAFWRHQLSSVPPERRLFLLPHCLKHAEGCPADYDQFGMNCKQCGACSIADFRSVAEDMGYRVLVAEGSPVVMKIIVGGYVDAVVGVACLNVLEKAIDKVLLAGIPCMAVPLLSSDCRNTKVDEPWVEEMIRTPYVPAAAKTRSYVHLMRSAGNLFGRDTLHRLAPPMRGIGLADPAAGENSATHQAAISQAAGVDGAVQRLQGEVPDYAAEAITSDRLAGVDPIAATEAIAYDFLARGGKHSRPFITLAAYDAAMGGDATSSDGETNAAGFPDAVRRAALSIETFHKASLVHDDIEDDDSYRYGQPAVHHRFGIASAINVGDYLIGLGYRLLSRDMVGDQVDAATRVDLLDSLAAAHVRLSEGQGAELLWRDAKDRRLQPIDALKIYALKTSPAFEAALYSGVRIAGDAAELVEPIRRFSRNLGVAFQIINDLNDWIGDDSNKLTAGADVIAGRPTLLWALALQHLDDDDQETLLGLASDDCEMTVRERLQTAERLYRKAGVFDLSLQLVDKHQARAEQVADELESEPLRRLLYFLVDTVLERPEMPTPATVTLSAAMPVA